MATPKPPDSSFGIFKKEEAALQLARDALESGLIDGPARKHFTELLKSYEKLYKSTRRLLRLSDRNEAELNNVAKDLEDKKATLEDLSQKLSKYLSPQIYESIFMGRSDVSLQTERKKLTVFFSDIKDFTATTADMQPEDLTHLLNSYFSEMSAIAIDYGATIDKFIGDAMLLFFGDPESKGVIEDARACVRMAVAMQRRMVDLRDAWRADGYDRPFLMRIGINTGYCNVGNFGSNQRMDYTIIGGEVNLAARLEAAADPGGILMSYETYALVKDIVTAEERQAIAMKGVRRKVKAYAVTDILEGIENEREIFHHEGEGVYFHLDAQRLEAEGREEVKAKLRNALARLENLP